MAITLEKDGRQPEGEYIASHLLTGLSDTTGVASGLESYFASVLSSIFCFMSCWRYGHLEEISTLQGAGQRSPMLEIQSSAATQPHCRDLETRGVRAVGGMEGSSIQLLFFWLLIQWIGDSRSLGSDLILWSRTFSPGHNDFMLGNRFPFSRLNSWRENGDKSRWLLLLKSVRIWHCTLLEIGGISHTQTGEHTIL